jgi:rfaE bifunctional protein nucleotidyltransferase chain/domain/rfaE bifunctional protein kinase chain/domain
MSGRFTRAPRRGATSGGGLVVVGDALLDRDIDGTTTRLAPDAPVPVLDERSVATRPGGAALAAALAAGAGHAVTLVTALSADAAGTELARLLASAGVEVVDLGLHGASPEKVRFTSAGRPLLRLDRGGDGRPGIATAAARAAIGWADGLLVSDYGRGVAADTGLRRALVARAAAVPLVWDPHPRGPVPVPGVTLATPNAAEALRFAGRHGDGQVDSLDTAAWAAGDLRGRWEAAAVCVTRGADGVLLDHGDATPVAVPVAPAGGGDPCGAGDRFAATAAGALTGGADVLEAVLCAAQAATAFVAAGGAAAFARSAAAGDGLAGGLDRLTGRAVADGATHDPLTLAAETRAAGGVVVATGGCFDLLHAGHVQTLAGARTLGDLLVVCLNDDASVRRLKGPGRPLVPAAERAAVLRALGCVDAVATFSEDTPSALLERLRPDVWVKGGDYAGTPLPEERMLARWGGRAVLLPHHAGHSTTRLIEEAHRAAR